VTSQDSPAASSSAAAATIIGVRSASACAPPPPPPPLAPPPSSAPSSATPSAPPACRAVLSTPLATPECSRPAEPTTTAVIAGMASDTRPSTIDPASSRPSDEPGPTRLSSTAPAAARTSPLTIGHRGPVRAVSQPLAVEPAPTAPLNGRMSSPVASADSCHACCRYSEMQISAPYRLRLNSTPTPVAALNGRDRNSRSGSTGDTCRRSVHTKHTAATRPAAPSTPGSGASQPCWPVSMKQAVIPARAAMPSTSPGMSARRSGSGCDSAT
jgi:hypothetical protein